MQKSICRATRPFRKSLTPIFATSPSRAYSQTIPSKSSKDFDHAKAPSTASDVKVKVDPQPGSNKVIIEETSAATDPPTRKKMVMELDEELKRKLEDMSGDGGAAGVDYEDGKPNAMKRGVRENMFRVI